MAKFTKLYTVYDKTTAYLTCHGLDEEVAEALGFEVYEPENGRFQFYIEKPNKKQLDKFLEALVKNGVTPKVISYSHEMSEELEWDEWDGYKHGIKDNPDMKAIGEKIIANDPDHSHLAAARIKYVYKKGKPPVDSDNGRITLAFVQLANSFSKHLGKWDFIMFTYELTWDHLSDEQKKRLVDHELHHLGFKGSPYLIGHDIEEFRRMHEKYNVPFGQSIYEDSQNLAKEILDQIKDAEEFQREQKRTNRKGKRRNDFDDEE